MSHVGKPFRRCPLQVALLPHSIPWARVILSMSVAGRGPIMHVIFQSAGFFQPRVITGLAPPSTPSSLPRQPGGPAPAHRVRSGCSPTAPSARYPPPKARRSPKGGCARRSPPPRCNAAPASRSPGGYTFARSTEPRNSFSNLSSRCRVSRKRQANTSRSSPPNSAVRKSTASCDPANACPWISPQAAYRAVIGRMALRLATFVGPSPSLPSSVRDGASITPRMDPLSRQQPIPERQRAVVAGSRTQQHRQQLGIAEPFVLGREQALARPLREWPVPDGIPTHAIIADGRTGSFNGESFPLGA